MGILKNGITGNCTGKIGGLAFYVRNGKQIIRTIGKMTKPATPAQLQNREELAVAVAFLRPVKEFVNAGFRLRAANSTKSAYNLAVAYNKKNALTGIYPNVSVNYEKVRVTEGTIGGADEAAAELTANGLKITWLCPGSLGWPRPYDELMLLVYFPVLQKAIYILSGASRQQCAEVLDLQPDLITKYMEVYISFVTQDRKGISNSAYLGSFNK
ncbi:DUF6266 family protein [Pedobacter heparinus]|uniref:DUF6266 family protein n=1 Tax=Pedobacter heparinus TaxID=984 RepID=UPI00292E8FB0|nr:DUF6266 family protein [Pedobacter heparinus]